MDTDSGTVEYVGDGIGAATTHTLKDFGLGADFYHLTINDASISNKDTFTLGAALDVNVNLTLTEGTLDVSATNYSIAVGGSWTDTGTGAFTERAGTVTFDGTGTLNSNEAFNSITVNGTAMTVTLGAALDVNDTLTLTAGTLDTSASNFSITAKSWTDSGAGAFTEGTSTVTFDVAGGTINSNEAFNSVTINHAGTTSLGASLDVNGALTITSGTLDVSASNYAITLQGNLTNLGTFTQRSGTVTLDGTSQTLNTTDSGALTFFNLTKIVSSAATLTLDDLDVFQVTNALTLKGAAAQLLTLTSDDGVNTVDFDLLAGGTQDLDYLLPTRIDSATGLSMRPTNST